MKTEFVLKQIRRPSVCSSTFLVAIVILVAACVYLNSIGNMFTNWDDSMIYANPEIRSLSGENLLRMFTPRKATTYQPIRALSYALDYHFWRLNPVGYHVTNIVVYILTCVTVFFTLRLLSGGLRGNASPDSHEQVAFFGSLLFTVHPVHVEAVTWLAARKEVLQGFFFFSAFYLYLKGREESGRKRITYFVFVLFIILLATLSKPSAVVFPAVILIYEIALRQREWVVFLRKYWLFFFSSVFVSALFTFILIKVMFDAGGVKPYRGDSFFNNLLVSFYAFLHNIKLLAFTINYSAAYTIHVPNPVLGFRTLLFVGMTLLLTGLSFWSLRRTKIFFFSFFFFVVTLLPYLNLVPISTLLADRYVFIASFSYVFLLGILFDHLYRYRNRRFSEGFFKILGVCLFLFILTGYSLMTIGQNRIWENSYTLWADTVEKHPESNTANALMGVVYMELGMDEKAVGYLERAVEILPYDYQSRNNLGIVYGRLDEPEKALRELITAIRLMPENDEIKINLAALYQRTKEYRKGEEIFKYIIGRDPGNANLHYRLGRFYEESGDFQAAVSELLKASELAPHVINPYEELGNIYGSRLKNPAKAIYYYSKGIEAVPKAKSRVEDLRWMVHDLECHR